MSAAQADARNGATRAARFDVRVMRDVRIPTADPAVTLAATLVLPVDAGPVPALVTVLPYLKDGGGGAQNEAELRWYAARGYAGVMVDLRGTGASDSIQRSPIDPDEAEDGVAAIEWAATQPWCTGRVGMWGMSYGAGVTLRTAARAPSQLKAILAIEGRVDVERDFVHPQGSAGCMGSLMWAGFMLYLQLLPPFEGYGTPAQTHRWLRRQNEMEPWILDFVRRQPGDPAWRAPALDPARIKVPSFCVAGMRDLFRDSTVRAFEQIDAPKKLLFGPWAHSLPHMSPFGSIDFRALSLEWWDQWLFDEKVDAPEPRPVTLCFAGGTNEWRQFESWPPVGKLLRLAADATGTLAARDTVEIAVPFCAAPVTGALSGLYELPTHSFRTPLDQHEDDLLGTVFDSDVLVDDVLLAGRPIVTVDWGTTIAPVRIVAHLTDVDPRGRSRLIAKGVLCGAAPARMQTISLGAVSYRQVAGHRLRLVLTSSDFPRLWPVEAPAQAPVIHGLTLDLPTLAHDAGTVAILDAPPPEPAAAPPLAHWAKPAWTITRDLATDGVEVMVGGSMSGLTPNREHRTEMRQETIARVGSADPRAASVQGNYTGTLHMKNGDIVTVAVDVHATVASVQARGEIEINGKPVFSRQWTAGVADEGTIA